MLTLITTPGASNANSYASLVEAEAYYNQHVAFDAWAAYTLLQLSRGLAHATVVLDRVVQWRGTIASTSQALLWPRLGVVDQKTQMEIASNIIPQWLKDATAETARALLDQDSSQGGDFSGLRRLRYGAIEAEFVGGGVQAVLPSAALVLIEPYSWTARGGMMARLQRV